jgi:hypothetical protein
MNVGDSSSWERSTEKMETVRATVLLHGKRGRKELITSVAVRDAALITSNPPYKSVKYTAQSMTHAT